MCTEEFVRSHKLQNFIYPRRVHHHANVNTVGSLNETALPSMYSLQTVQKIRRRDAIQRKAHRRYDYLCFLTSDEASVNHSVIKKKLIASSFFWSDSRILFGRHKFTERLTDFLEHKITSIPDSYHFRPFLTYFSSISIRMGR